MDVGGAKTPYIIDRWTDGQPSSRINYESVEFNRNIPAAIFAKTQSIKEAKKEVKY